MELREPIERLIRDPKEFTRDVGFPDPAEIRIYDETLRDGEQMPGVCYTPAQKLEIAKALAAIGVHVMSVGFPAASEGDRRTLQLVMDAKHRGELGDVEIVVMCRSNRKDIDVTVKTLRDAGIDPREVTFFIFTSGSDLHLKYKIGKTLLRFEGRDEGEWLDLPSSSIATRTSGCNATRFVTRGSAASNGSSSAPKTEAAATSNTSSSISRRDSTPAARVRRGRTPSERLRPKRPAGTARGSCTGCPKACRSSRTCTTTTAWARSTRSRRRPAGSRSFRSRPTATASAPAT